MKFVITGGAGNISLPLSKHVLAAGHDVTVIGRNANNLKALVAAGAKTAIGSVTDRAFLTQTFTGADAVYTMVPPIYEVSDWKGYIGSIGENYAAAIRAAGVPRVVNLSSVGADLPDGCGPVSGLYRSEQALNTLTDVHIIHLRPSYFYQNLLANIGLIKAMGIMGSNFSFGKGGLPIVDPADIAEVAAGLLLKQNFTAHSVQYIASDEVSTDQIAAEIGASIGQPSLPWVNFSDDQALEGMLQAGLPKEIATNYVEMGHAMHNGIMLADYFKHRPTTLGNTKLADFAKVFAQVFQQAS